MKSRVIQPESQQISADSATSLKRRGPPEHTARGYTGLSASIKRHPLVAFFVLAFALT